MSGCPPGIQEALAVSRETVARLETYVHLLLTWNKRIGLIGRETADDIWRRHILDCGQLYKLITKPEAGLVDLGSGAGLPGLVLAIMGVRNVHLIEANQRKAVFLREAARVTQAPAMIHALRIEEVRDIRVGTVTARALAPIDRLLDYAQAFAPEAGNCLFLKGARADSELTLAEKNWTMHSERYPSLSDPAGIILRIREFRRAQ